MILLLASIIAAPVWAGNLDSDLAGIQGRWAEIQYQLPEDQKEKAFEDLAGQAQVLVDTYPDRAEPLIWQGIVLSTYAGAKGGLGALGLVKDARKSLEKALEIDPAALEGSAYTSLGSLYYQVPGWPLGFGDDDKARKYLLKALELNPNGIDPNYFYGDFLIEQDQPERAREYLNKALNAPERPNRPVADAGRRKEIRSKLEQI
ncbi:tetratricopeptide repeat protein [Marinobacter sp.]|uniref:tetratricopeptide repeat protein n=1 Tax=Marinobacter sp. TaxID=50741 RepID=UPI003569CD3C